RLAGEGRGRKNRARGGARRGRPPLGANKFARRTKYAARGTDNRLKMQPLMKEATSLRIEASQHVPMAPGVEGTGKPKKLNHIKSWGSVIMMADHRSHFVNPPPI